VVGAVVLARRPPTTGTDGPDAIAATGAIDATGETEDAAGDITDPTTETIDEEVAP
jgi:hypothetical protein